MATFIAQTSAAGTADTVTTSAIDTTGASLIVLGVSYNTGAVPVITDNKGNTWIGLTAQAVAANGTSRIYFCSVPSSGSGHTFTNGAASNFSSLSVIAFSGTSPSSPFDQIVGTTQAASATIAPGSLTTLYTDELLISHFMFSVAGTASVNASFSSPTQQNFSGGVNYGSAMAYLIQSASGTTVSPTWTSGGGATGLASTMVTFRSVKTTISNYSPRLIVGNSMSRSEIAN